MNNDLAYANSAFIPGGDAFPARWQAAATEFRNTNPSRLDLPYGSGERQKFDLFLPTGTPRGLVVFLHGGYWMESDKSDWSHLAAGAVGRGWACAMVGYSLAPAVRIAEITAEAALAITTAVAMVPGPVVVTGHSAGGHLAARMGCADVRLSARIERVVPISPLSDLSPLMDTTMNRTLWIDPEEALAESPALHALRGGVRAHVWVGGQERPAFLWQARTLSEAWDCPWTVAAGRHHFDVIECLQDTDSTLMGILTDGL
jgi:arylformamidase